MLIKTKEELDGIRKAGQTAGEILKKMRQYCKPGLSTKEIDLYGGRLMKEYGVRSAPILAYNFPGFTCISVNDVVAHGVPSTQTILREDDLINIDVSIEQDGFWADNGGSFTLGQQNSPYDHLIDASRDILKQAIFRIKHGMRVSELGGYIHDSAKKVGYTVIKNLTGHGVGRSLHEEPRSIANYREAFNFRRFRENEVVAIETFISTKSEFTKTDNDGWTLRGDKGGFVAQHEHTILVTRQEPEILTLSNEIWS
ncbi:MAG: type I methionyl aminopeptidase [Saprospiraceae bacterium]|jgi:methionyl aminopeptidase|nr:MAG: methionine aminopeptidase [Candidatus Parvibacillus calidus]MBX2936656.1 type I methionyl aminopeptidase [Saprospiraceae bacterium]MBK7739468.1 type I methionyl aminopeptidase [Candidatus Parvibacillus calidus]MBX7178051.1 type I methionyl aminopeptidase [Saprospiraceae bacterium]MCB0591232.1 type I methionyl aminopeptidase [Saprospiraceae bacterium]